MTDRIQITDLQQRAAHWIDTLDAAECASVVGGASSALVRAIPHLGPDEILPFVNSVQVYLGITIQALVRLITVHGLDHDDTILPALDDLLEGIATEVDARVAAAEGGQ